ncbi:MAG: hypothetical protein JW801_04810 [Bacteroidales bacterium]|nr:hypothetical protein [Bacteroidales bacterium]
MNNLRALTTLLCSFFLLSFSQATDKEASSYSKESLMEFGKQLENSLTSQNPYYFNLSFDTETLLNTIFTEYGQSPDQAFHQGFIDGITSTLDLGNLLVNELSAGGSIQLLSVRNNSERPGLIFRLIGSKGINYHEYFVDSAEGKLILSDAYIYSTGQLLSESVGELYVSSWYNTGNSYSPEIEKINQLKASGKYRKAFHKWENLPEQVRREKSNLLLGIDLGSALDPNSFFTVYNLFSLYYPEEPGKYLIPLNGLISSGLYETALQNIDSLDLSVQHDPMLNFVRANIYYAAKRIDRAEDCLYKLIGEMPQFELAYFSLLDIYLQETNYLEATAVLNQMVRTFQYYKEDYTPLFTEYPDFVNSPEYRVWLEQ